MSTSVDTVTQFSGEHGRGMVGVLVVHDQEIVHYGWRLLLSRHKWITRCLAATSKAEAVALAHRYAPTVAILDLDAGPDQVADVIDGLQAAVPWIRVLLVSGATTIGAREARAMCATGVVSKALNATDLAAAVRAVASGKRLFAITTPQGANRLSKREKQVLGLMSSGATNREIAEQLDVSAETIKRHAAAIFRKLDVRNRTEAAQRGREMGLAVSGLQRERAALLSRR